MVDGEPAGMGIRESDGLITDNLSYFVPHTVDFAPPRAGRRPRPRFDPCRSRGSTNRVRSSGSATRWSSTSAPAAGRATRCATRGLPVVVFSTRGVKSGNVRKQPLMKVEKDGAYLMVGSQGGAPSDPAWVSNLRAAPDQVTVQDGPEPWDGVARELSGEERDEWWERAVAAFPDYADYQKKTDRQIPIFLVERR